MTRDEIERASGQTPCLCGDIETWHSACYEGKTEGQIKAGYDRAYRVARVKLQQRANQQVARALYQINRVELWRRTAVSTKKD